MIKNQIEKARATYREFPSTFWTLIGARFIDQLGGSLVYPFFALFITHKFGVGMTEVGILFALFSLTSVGGNVIGGALADRLGRKKLIILGLIISAITSMALALSPTIEAAYATALFVGLFSNIGGPASGAMIGDILPERQRTQGFGILRVVFNLAVAIGPAIGGMLAGVSYLLLFAIDAVTSLITAVIVAKAIPETLPASAEDGSPETVSETFGGYGRILRDAAFMVFFAAATLMMLGMVQLHGTLAVFLRDVHGYPDRGYGLLLSLNATMVVLFQFYITRKIERFPPYLMLMLGAGLYVVAFGMFGVVSGAVLFVLAVIIMTIGEMLVAPVAQALVIRLAPEDMRGRYMALFGFSGMIGNAAGPLLAGLIMDNLNPSLVWFAASLSMVLAGILSWFLHRRDQLKSSKILPAQEAHAFVQASD
jgi:MFS family permease